MLEPAKSSLVAIVGPTGCGKSALGLRLARAFSAEIVNFDSVQVYRGLNIGSAKTPPESRNGVPHHLLDVASAAEDLTAGAYAELARKCLQKMAARSVLPILVGGTGFYLRSLLEGLPAAPDRNPALRERLRQLAVRRPEALHRYLRRVDGAATGRIHANDHQKLIRAIEIASDRSGFGRREPLGGFRVLKIGLNPAREELYRKLNARSAAMFEAGLLEEVRELLEAGVPATAKALQSLGYRQALAVIEKRMSVAEAVSELQTRTRQYAKRQMTWFRREAEVRWLDGFGDEKNVQRAGVEMVGEFLGGGERSLVGI